MISTDLYLPDGTILPAVSRREIAVDDDYEEDEEDDA
tara:strand:- start:281 stop:391 length:111 start_codon:yes stop_codon:yes gene_type:complete